MIIFSIKRHFLNSHELRSAKKTRLFQTIPNRLHALPDCYKIKLRSSGYRMVYQVFEREIMVFVVAVDKRERDQVYRKAAERLGQ